MQIELNRAQIPKRSDQFANALSNNRVSVFQQMGVVQAINAEEYGSGHSGLLAPFKLNSNKKKCLETSK